MSEKQLLFPKRCAKSVTSELDWKNLKCNKCGSNLLLKKTNEYEDVKYCPKCNSKYIRIKKLREWEDE